MFNIKSLRKFAVIEKLEDEIELKDLTIFMGDNSAGKSYLAMLIHSFISMTAGYIKPDFLKAIKSKFENKKFIQELQKTIDTIISKNNQNNSRYTIYFDEADLQDLETIIDFSVNEYLIKKYLVQKVFDSATIEHINIELKDIKKHLFHSFIISIQNSNDELQIELSIDNEIIGNVNFQGNMPSELIKEELLNIFISRLIEITIKKSLPINSVYLPASRTGYLQTYKILANKAVLSNYTKEETDSKDTLSIMVRFFITQLNTNTTFEENKFSKFIEDFIINGKVNIYKDNSDIDFELSDGTKIDLNYLSSTVSELIPLVVFLKRGLIKAGGLVVIEEPEAHLSFKNQKLIAKFVVLLMQNNIKVLITTHSDFFIYEINNLIIKNTILKNREKLHLEKDFFDDNIALDYKKVALYNFILKNESSTVKRIEIDKYGINNTYIFDSTYATSKEKNKLLDLMDSLDA